MSASSLRANLVASRSADADTIDLFGTILEAAAELKLAGDTIYYATRSRARPSEATLAKARAAIKKASDALDAHRAGEGG